MIDTGRWPPVPASRVASWYCPAPDCPERGFPVPVRERYGAGRWWPDTTPRCTHCGAALEPEPPE